MKLAIAGCGNIAESYIETIELKIIYRLSAFLIWIEIERKNWLERNIMSTTALKLL